ncbi:TraY domain-containing protein [Algiphilus sp.]|uniref:type II toxin-antitoxin system RelB family antitoxin n=1 Tax=Algiphilus sp. TaxID=1872431 RepID=UPI0025C0CAEE|nr:TraY domain-containing protein [Algiphilus sp.]MCK5769592.1 TraY domain-containing protein [Algiphilus sp.]
MTISVRLPPETEARLDALAKQTGRTKTFYLQEMIKRSLDDMEDYYLAAETVTRIRKGEESTSTSAEVRKRLGLED